MSKLIPIGITRSFGNTKAQLYIPTNPMTYEEIVAEARVQGIYKEWTQSYARKLIKNISCVSVKQNVSGDRIHYTFTPIKAKEKNLCLDAWHSVHSTGKEICSGAEKRKMENSSIWNRDSGVAFLFRCHQ